MADLSVTDVQRMLREHADMGHDVLQHPHQVVILGKPYGMRVDARLMLSKADAGKHALASNLMLSERPLISNIVTRFDDTALAITPYSPVRDDYGDSFMIHAGLSPAGMFYSHHGKHPTRAQSAHEALQAHVNTRLEHVGADYRNTNHGGSYKLHKNFGDFNPPFDMERALTSHIGGNTRPFSGLIRVTRSYPGKFDDFETYHYDPKTEQLTRHS